MYEERLQKLFDYQHVAGNSRLGRLIAESDSRQFTVLARDDMQQVNAAGSVEARRQAAERSK